MRVLLTVLVIFLSLKNNQWCLAQDAILDTNKLPKSFLVFEEYLDQSKEGIPFSDATGKGYLKKGQYYYENKTNEAREYYNPFNIDPKEDYYIELVFSRMSGRLDEGSGFLFNHSSTKEWNEYNFLITSDQYFLIKKTVNSVDAFIQPWTASKHIKSNGKNKLAIFAKGDFMYFYINDALVHKMKRPPYLGTNIGYFVAPKTVVALDRFIIRYNPLPFNVIPDAVQGYQKNKLDNNINSATDDNFPVLSADGKMMFFTRSENMGVIDLDTRTIMSSEYNDSTQSWTAAIPLPSVINQGGLPQVVYVSPDKTILIINATFENGKHITDEGLSISYKTDNGWTSPEKMFIENYENLCHYEAYALSANNKVMILSVHTSKGYGELDLYVSFRINGTTSWTSPQNLGSIVNSFGIESGPCLAQDNMTLYYYSGGKPGYGQTDFFITRRLDDTWLNWSQPLNMGPAINTAFYETTLTLDGKGEYAFVDLFDSITNSDIYRIRLPESARPKPFVLAKGKVYDKLTNRPIAATVLYENIERKTDQANSMFDKKGTFEFVLVYGASYEFSATAKGYLAETKLINLKDTLMKEFAEVNIDIYVTPLVEGNSIALNSVIFAVDQYTFLETSFLELERLYNVMVGNPNLIIEVQGHVDAGDADSKDVVLNELSLNRANAVRDYLVSKGISSERIKTIGYGRSKPISKNNRALNRRVEVKVIKNE